MVPTKRSAMALARGARTGVRTIWMLLQVKTASKAAVNLASRSRMRNRGRRPASSRVHDQVASQLSQPRSGRVRGDAEDVDAAGGVLDDEECVQPLQCDGVDMEQVAGQDPARLDSQELGAGGSGSPG
jgi:hypothetical protein